MFLCFISDVVWPAVRACPTVPPTMSYGQRCDGVWRRWFETRFFSTLSEPTLYSVATALETRLLSSLCSLGVGVGNMSARQFDNVWPRLVWNRSFKTFRTRSGVIWNVRVPPNAAHETTRPPTRPPIRHLTLVCFYFPFESHSFNILMFLFLCFLLLCFPFCIFDSYMFCVFPFCIFDSYIFFCKFVCGFPFSLENHSYFNAPLLENKNRQAWRVL